MKSGGPIKNGKDEAMIPAPETTASIVEHLNKRDYQFEVLV